MKQCTNCKEFKPFDEFYKAKNSKDGFTYYCKECLKKSSTSWAKNNPEKNAQKQRKWNKEHLNYASQLWQKQYSKDPEKNREKCKNWKKNNPEKHRQWAIDNPEKVIASRRKYLRRRKFLMKETDITVKFLLDLKEETANCCLCEKELIDYKGSYHPDQRQLDHIIPLCVGGTHTKNNVRYVCAYCNNHRPRSKQTLYL